MPDFSKASIIIEDSTVTARIIGTVLAQVGYPALEHSLSGDQALSLYETYRPAILSMDINIPGRDGIEVAEEILKKHSEANVIFFSVLMDRVKRCSFIGGKMFIQKSLMFGNRLFTDDLKKTLDAIVEGRSLEIGVFHTLRIFTKTVRPNGFVVYSASKDL